MNQSSVWWMYALGSAFFAALTTILAKVGVRNVNSNFATAVRTTVILLFAWGIVLIRREYVGATSLSSRTALFLVLSGLATGLSWLCYFRALQIGPTTPVAAIDKSSLALILVLSAIFLNEPLTWKSVTAVVLISLGTLVLLV